MLGELYRPSSEAESYLAVLHGLAQGCTYSVQPPVHEVADPPNCHTPTRGLAKLTKPNVAFVLNNLA